MMSNRYFEILSDFDDVLSFLGYVVNEFGNPIGLKMKKENELFFEGTHHDYVYFCFTKILRSCCAFNELAKKGFREDCMIIGRSIYESYLQVSNALKNPKFIEISVFQTLKIKARLLKFDRNKVYDLSNKSWDHDLRTFTLAKNTLSLLDSKLHKLFYRFMSELIHSNFISVGNYRTSDNLKYDVDTNKPNIEVIFTLGYFLFLTCEHMEYYHLNFDSFRQTDLSVPVIIEFSCMKKKLKIVLLEMIDVIKISGNYEIIRKIFLERITQNIIGNNRIGEKQ